MKTGIMGGSFDPVHNGHLSLALDALAQADLDRIILIPARIQPFKQDRKTASGEDRYNMLQLAASEDKRLIVSREELDSDGVSYTYLTLGRLQKKYPEDRLYFICGSDSFVKIDTWMKAEEILTNYSIIVGCDRPGYDIDDLNEAVTRIKNSFGTEIVIINNRQVDVSSTEIRDNIQAGKPVNHMVPLKVAEYINDRNLYE